MFKSRNVPRMGHSVTLYLVALCLSSLSGCAPDGPVTYPVSGEVKVDGEPLKDGLVVFRDKDGQLSSHAIQILDGSYALRSTAGAKRIEITAYRETGQFSQPDPNEPATPVMQQYIAPHFNSDTTLEVEVGPDKDNRFDFAVKSVPGAPK
ncbi:MAG: hypothetical protein AB7F89_21185 [Pirellulaceae bacterium]